ncbi:MAG: tRNA uridine-5-carboxymethylaminomethyl(34) synthesis GTPase MnmE [Bacilli bacterium]|nr:tRNA uridine-5-carboxymethylaminomethyl(34) synthesis GTPase MnmE [Bacilli bacterium]
MEDTICAISTAPGIGAISIIRVSGPKTLDIVSQIYRGKNLKEVESHTINYGFIYDDEEKIDEVLVSVMLAPKTYTMEDIIEINSHGGINTTNKILELLLEKGCRLAEPGEFTKKAFLNGRIDLIEAESVNDLINAKNDAARNLALNNMKGNLTNKIRSIREIVVGIMANIEVNIDYPEYEDIEIVTKDTLLPKLSKVKMEIEDILKDSRNGRLINEGINIAIVGKPNVGKSSILNSLLDEEKAIVTNIAGTTRDIVEGSMTLNGFLIKFIDTAGIRDTEDVVEKIGVEKSKKAIETADLVILVLNNNEDLTDYDKELLKMIPTEKRIIFINKSDLDKKIKIDFDYITGNTIDQDGLLSLKEAIINKLKLDNILNKDMTYMSNVRQIDLLKKSLSAIENAIQNLEAGMPVDIAEIDITNAWNLLGEITGDTYQDELITTLFSNFCLGK